MVFIFTRRRIVLLLIFSVMLTAGTLFYIKSTTKSMQEREIKENNKLFDEQSLDGDGSCV